MLTYWVSPPWLGNDTGYSIVALGGAGWFEWSV